MKDTDYIANCLFRIHCSVRDLPKSRIKETKPIFEEMALIIGQSRAVALGILVQLSERLEREAAKKKS